MDLKIGSTFRRDAELEFTIPIPYIDPLDQDSIDASFAPEAPLPDVILPGERWLISTVEKLMIPRTCKYLSRG